MSMTFVKLFSSITESTIWMEDDATRLAWIAMLAMSDKHGRVFGSIPGLANRARISVEACETAIGKFLAPDSYSRTTAHEGRRIEPIDGGWRLLNHAKYRAIRDEEAIKESKRKYINDRRAREREAKSLGVEQPVEKVGQSRDNAEADTESDSEARMNERKNAQGAVSIPEELLRNGEFTEAWKLHLESISGRKDKAMLAKRHMGLCILWSKKHGIEPVIQCLSAAVNHGSRFLAEPR